MNTNMWLLTLFHTLQLLSAPTPAPVAFPAEIDYAGPLGAEAYVYLNPEEGATARIDDPDAYYWYALANEHGRVTLASIDWQRYYDNDAELGIQPRPEPTDGRVRLLIGSLRPLVPGTVNGRFYEGYASSFGRPPALNTPLLTELGLGLLGDHREAELWLRGADRVQQLNRDVAGYPSHVVFRGDIDRDGTPDLVLSYGDTRATEVLYLSGVAAEGALLGEAASCTYRYWE